jgi:hypothetical protein
MTHDDCNSEEMDRIVRDAQRRVKEVLSEAISLLSQGEAERARPLLAHCAELVRKSANELGSAARGGGLKRLGMMLESQLDKLAGEISDLVRSLEADRVAGGPVGEADVSRTAPQTELKRSAEAAGHDRRQDSRSTGTSKSFKLSATECKAINKFMNEQQGSLALYEIGQLRQREYSEDSGRRAPEECPGRTEEEYTARRMIHWLNCSFLVERGIARRLIFDAPSELAACVVLEGRFEWMTSYGMREENCYPSIWPLLRALSAADFVVAQKFTETFPYPLKVGDRDVVALYNGIFAVLGRDMKSLQSLMPTLQKRKPPQWIAAMFACLIGIVENSAGLVAEGLDRMHQTARRRAVGPIEKLIYLEMHGMYELCRWFSPTLVSEFDTDRSFPWDRAYCNYVRKCVDPAVNIHLEDVSPLLHRWVTTLCRPFWWIQPDPNEIAEAQERWSQFCLKLKEHLQKAFGGSTTEE